MTNAFDDLIAVVQKDGYYNQRDQEHSDVICRGILRDLLNMCEPLKADLDSGVVHAWPNVRTHGGRGRKIDLLIAEPLQTVEAQSPTAGKRLKSKPNIQKARICIENKSVLTAHRNKGNRYDDLDKLLDTVHAAQAEAVLIATVLVGIADRFLNVPDGIKPNYKKKPEYFENSIRPRLSKGDETLWDEFDWAVSTNTLSDAKKTVDRFSELKTRQPGHTHIKGYDYLLIVPIFIDNVHPAYIPRPNNLGIDVDQEYDAMLTQICKAYRMRWHP